MERQTVIRLSAAEVEDLVRKGLDLDKSAQVFFSFKQIGSQYDPTTILSGVEVRVKPEKK